MSMTRITATNAMHKLSAGTILSPRELKYYRRWQRLFTTLKPAEQGYVPSATEYRDFQLWLKRQDSGYHSDIFEYITNHITPTGIGSVKCGFETPVASICKHAMHPVAMGYAPPRCPVCTIDVHVNYMKVLTNALESAGGRAPSCTLTASEHQDTVYSAWMFGKVCTLRELSALEIMAEDEHEWSAQHPEAIFEDIKTASEALNMYWYDMLGCEQKKPSSSKDKYVVFAQDTLSTPGRPAAYFWKKSLRYEPGKYTIVGQGDEGDSGISEDSEDYFQDTPIQVGTSANSASDLRFSNSTRQFRFHNTAEELDEDDDNSEWEDLDSEGDNHSLNVDREKGNYIDFETDDEASFIVFTDD